MDDRASQPHVGEMRRDLGAGRRERIAGAPMRRLAHHVAHVLVDHARHDDFDDDFHTEQVYAEPVPIVDAATLRPGCVAARQAAADTNPANAGSSSFSQKRKKPCWSGPIWWIPTWSNPASTHLRIMST